MESRSALERLDPNFATTAAGSDLRWYDARQLIPSGQGWERAHLAEPWDRLPAHAEPLVRPEVWALAQQTAGLWLDFRSDASELALSWTLRRPDLCLDHMPASGVSGLDLYLQTADGWRWAALARARAVSNQQALATSIPACGERTYRLYLPLYNGITDLRLGIPATASLIPTPAAARRPIVVYGTSIVQGGCASRPGMAYPAILGRTLDHPVLNLGFSGNGRGEPEVAHLLAELDPAVFVLDPLPNLTVEQVGERLPRFIAILRAARPLTPIILVGNVTYLQQTAFGRTPSDCARKNAVLYELFAAHSASDPALHLVRGEDLLGADGEGTVDGVHPTDLGFTRLAAALAPVVRRVLGT